MKTKKELRAPDYEIKISNIIILARSLTPPILLSTHAHLPFRSQQVITELQIVPQAWELQNALVHH